MRSVDADRTALGSVFTVLRKIEALRSLVKITFEVIRMLDTPILPKSNAFEVMLALTYIRK